MNIVKIFLSDQLQIVMLATSEPDCAISFQLTSNFDFHLNPCLGDFHHNTYNFAIIEVDDIIWLKVFLNLVIVDPKICLIRGHMVLPSEHIDGGSTSDSQSRFWIHKMRKSHLSPSSFNHKGTSLMRSKTLR